MSEEQSRRLPIPAAGYRLRLRNVRVNELNGLRELRFPLGNGNVHRRTIHNSTVRLGYVVPLENGRETIRFPFQIRSGPDAYHLTMRRRTLRRRVSQAQPVAQHDNHQGRVLHVIIFNH